jgi:hypothetical protein
MSGMSYISGRKRLSNIKSLSWKKSGSCFKPAPGWIKFSIGSSKLKFQLPCLDCKRTQKPTLLRSIIHIFLIRRILRSFRFAAILSHASAAPSARSVVALAFSNLTLRSWSINRCIDGHSSLSHTLVHGCFPSQRVFNDLLQHCQSQRSYRRNTMPRKLTKRGRHSLLAELRPSSPLHHCS